MTAGTVQTVLGAIEPAQLGFVHMHEHLLCDLTGYLTAEQKSAGDAVVPANYTRSRVDRDNPDDMRLDDADVATAELRAFGELGGGTLVDVTSVGLGRRPRALAEISRDAGVHVVMGTSFYAQAFHPKYVPTLSIDDIEAGITRDIVEGAEQSGIRAGIIGEVGMSHPASRDETRILVGSTRAARATGASLLVHPGRDVTSPFDHLDLIEGEGLPLDRVVMSHVDRTLFTLGDMIALAERGCILEFDLFGVESSYYPQNPDVDLPNDAMRANYIRDLITEGFVSQIVMAQDVCRKTQLRHYGGEGYGHILQRVIPLLRRKGISDDDIATLTVGTPRRLLTLV
jgi:phosphotriesterase-related protein